MTLDESLDVLKELGKEEERTPNQNGRQLTIEVLMSKHPTKMNFFGDREPISEEELNDILQYIPDYVFNRELHGTMSSKYAFESKPSTTHDLITAVVSERFDIYSLLDELEENHELEFEPYVIEGKPVLCISYNRFIRLKDAYSFCVYDSPNLYATPIWSSFDGEKVYKIMCNRYGELVAKNTVLTYSLISMITNDRNCYALTENAVCGALDKGYIHILKSWIGSSTTNKSCVESTALNFLNMFIPDIGSFAKNSPEQGCLCEVDEPEPAGRIYQVGNGALLFWTDGQDVYVKIKLGKVVTYRMRVPLSLADCCKDSVPKIETLPVVRVVTCVVSARMGRHTYLSALRDCLEMIVTFTLNVFGVRVTRTSADVIVKRDAVTNVPEKYIEFNGLDSYEPFIETK